MGKEIDHPNATEKDTFLVVCKDPLRLERTMFQGMDITAAEESLQEGNPDEGRKKQQQQQQNQAGLLHFLRLFLWVFCLPPHPRKITNKLAFTPPESGSSYSFVTQEMMDDSEKDGGKKLRPVLEVLFELQGKYANQTVVVETGGGSQGQGQNDGPNPANSAEQPHNQAAATPAKAGNEASSSTNATSQRIPRIYDSQKVEGFYALRSQSGNRVACVHIEQSKDAPFTFLYSHGNSCDLGHILHFLSVLCSVTKCNLLTYDYSGYGESSGIPSEQSMYEDHMAAFTVLLSRYRLPPNKIILFGHSIGTVAAIELASRIPVGGVVLEAPLYSGLKTLRCCRLHESGCIRKRLNPFPSYMRAPLVHSPVLVIHGTQDEVIALEDGAELSRMFPTAVEPLFIKGAGHNNLCWYVLYYARILVFLYMELLGKTPGETMQIIDGSMRETYGNKFGGTSTDETDTLNSPIHQTRHDQQAGLIRRGAGSVDSSNTCPTIEGSDEGFAGSILREDSSAQQASATRVFMKDDTSAAMDSLIKSSGFICCPESYFRGLGSSSTSWGSSNDGS